MVRLLHAKCLVRVYCQLGRTVTLAVSMWTKV